ncbi:MAG: lipoyltransferase, partial [Novosphingobium sp.]
MMNFDSNRAWLEAIAAVKACRTLLLPIAGVFFLVPSVASSFLLGDIQTQIFANMENREVLNGIFQAEMGKIMGVTLVSLIAGFVGYLCVIALLT